MFYDSPFEVSFKEMILFAIERWSIVSFQALAAPMSCKDVVECFNVFFCICATDYYNFRISGEFIYNYYKSSSIFLWSPVVLLKGFSIVFLVELMVSSGLYVSSLLHLGMLSNLEQQQLSVCTYLGTIVRILHIFSWRFPQDEFRALCQVSLFLCRHFQGVLVRLAEVFCHHVI